MPPPRRPTALGPAPAPQTLPAGRRPRSPVPGGEDQEERTTVDDALPVRGKVRRAAPAARSTAAIDESWDERTTVEEEKSTVSGRPHDPHQETTRDDSAEVLLHEATVRDDGAAAKLAEGSGEAGASTIDEPTVEDQARPLPPLAAPALPGRALVTPDPVRARLVVIAGNDSGRTFDLSGTRVTVGRGVDNDIILTDIAVSRRHIEVEFDGRAYALRDLGSGNGTLINDRFQDGASALRHGDRLELGNTVFRFEHPASKADVSPVGLGRSRSDDDDEEEASTVAHRASMRLGGGAGLPPPRREPRLPMGRPAGLPQMPPGASPEPGRLPASFASPPSTLATVPVPEASASIPRAPTLALQAPPQPPAMSQPMAYPTGYGVPSSMSPLDSMALPEQAQLRVPTISLAPDRRLLVGVMGALLAIVLIAIVVLVVRGDDAPRLAAGEAAAAAKEPSADPDVTAAPGPSENSAADDPGDAPVLVGEPIMHPGEPILHDQEPADEPAPTAEANTDGAEPAKPVRLPVRRSAGARPLPVSTWGTAEATLAAAYQEKAQQTVAEREAARAVPPPTPAPRRVIPRRSAASTTRTSNVAAARSRAASLYKDKDFSKAADALRQAAESTSADDAKELRALATNYEAIGTNLSRAERSEAANPTEALAAYRRALALDKSAGGSAHASYIRIKLGAVAPKAAAAYMAQRRYEAAKTAADAAANYGSGTNPTVVRVRTALDRKAGEFYNAALKVRTSKPDEARNLLRRILKMVPADNPWYIKAYKALNARSKTSDQDE